MAFLEQFEDEDKKLIVSLPYRVGVWVGSVDEVGGAKANFEEISALERIITEQSKGMFESAFVHEVMSETFACQDNWKAWSENLDNVPTECTQAVEKIASKLAEKDVDAYRANVMGIGLEVAKAFREFDAEETFFVKLVIKFKLFVQAMARIITRDRSFDQVSALNISYEEDMALTKLSEALHPEVKVSSAD